MVSIGNGDGMMSEVHKADLELRIEEDRHKIQEISAFRDDPKIDKIIRALQKQIAQDFLPIEFDGPGFETSLTLASRALGACRS